MIRKLEEFTIEAEKLDEMKNAERLLEEEESKKEKVIYDPFTEFIPLDEIKS